MAQRRCEAVMCKVCSMVVRGFVQGLNVPKACFCWIVQGVQAIARDVRACVCVCVRARAHVYTYEYTTLHTLHNLNFLLKNNGLNKNKSY